MSNKLRALSWRLFYGVAGSRLSIAAAGLVLDALAVIRGPHAAMYVIGLFEKNLVHSGWPFYSRGWINLHFSRVATRIRRRGKAMAPKQRRAVNPQTRVAVVGRFVGLLGFPKELLDACPVELVVADLAHQGSFASYLDQPGRRYAAFDLESGGASAADVAKFVNASGADMVLNIGQRVEAFDILDAVDAPCVANFCAGSDLLHHPKVDVQYHGQPQADYFERDGRMFCGTTRSVLPSGLIHTITGYMDPRGLLGQQPAAWADRDPLIVCHGSLYKYAAQPFCDALMHVVKRNAAVRLVLMGRDDGRALAAILDAAARASVGDRVEYLGQFSAMRGADGEVSDPGWLRMLALLRRARLAPNAFPLGGGSSRLEAYLTGVPTAHLAVRFDEDAWGRPQLGTCEVPSLLAPLGTARTIDEYGALCDRLLADGAYADRLCAQQLELARKVVDPGRWWTEVLSGFTRYQAIVADGNAAKWARR